MYFLDKYGWPIERIKGRWFFNFLRLVIHTRKIKRKFQYAPLPVDPSVTCFQGNTFEDFLQEALRPSKT